MHFEEPSSAVTGQSIRLQTNRIAWHEISSCSVFAPLLRFLCWDLPSLSVGEFCNLLGTWGTSLESSRTFGRSLPFRRESGVFLGSPLSHKWGYGELNTVFAKKWMHYICLTLRIKCEFWHQAKALRKAFFWKGQYYCWQLQLIVSPLQNNTHLGLSTLLLIVFQHFLTNSLVHWKKTKNSLMFVSLNFVYLSHRSYQLGTVTRFSKGWLLYQPAWCAPLETDCHDALGGPSCWWDHFTPLWTVPSNDESQ